MILLIYYRKFSEFTVTSITSIVDVKKRLHIFNICYVFSYRKVRNVWREALGIRFWCSVGFRLIKPDRDNLVSMPVVINVPRIRLISDSRGRAPNDIHWPTIGT